jgi:hypothetical protein
MKPKQLMQAQRKDEGKSIILGSKNSPVDETKGSSRSFKNESIETAYLGLLQMWLNLTSERIKSSRTVGVDKAISSLL